YGKMLRPLDIQPEKISREWYIYNCGKESLEYNDSGSLCVESIIHTAWKYRAESIGLFFANISDSQQSLNLDWDISKFQVNKTEVNVRIGDEDGLKVLFAMDTSEKRKVDLELPPKSVIMLEIY